MLKITATEFKSNFGKYLDLLNTETIIITKNNKPIAKVTNAAENRTEKVKSIFGIIPDTGYTLEDAKNERISKK